MTTAQKKRNVASKLVNSIYNADPSVRRDADFMAIHPDTWTAIRAMIDHTQELPKGNSHRTVMGYKTVLTRDVEEGSVEFLSYAD